MVCRVDARAGPAGASQRPCKPYSPTPTPPPSLARLVHDFGALRPLAGRGGAGNHDPQGGTPGASDGGGSGCGLGEWGWWVGGPGRGRKRHGARAGAGLGRLCGPTAHPFHPRPRPLPYASIARRGGGGAGCGGRRPSGRGARVWPGARCRTGAWVWVVLGWGQSQGLGICKLRHRACWATVCGGQLPPARRRRAASPLTRLAGPGRVRCGRPPAGCRRGQMAAGTPPWSRRRERLAGE